MNILTIKKWTRFVFFLVFTVTYFSASAYCGELTKWTGQPLPEEKVREMALKEFGTKKHKPIETGFLLIDGKYVPPPYIMEQRGHEIYINDILIYRYSQYPFYTLDFVGKPKLPKIDKEGSSLPFLFIHQEDPRFEMYLDKLFAYHLTQHPADRATAVYHTLLDINTWPNIEKTSVKELDDAYKRPEGRKAMEKMEGMIAKFKGGGSELLFFKTPDAFKYRDKPQEWYKIARAEADKALKEQFEGELYQDLKSNNVVPLHHINASGQPEVYDNELYLIFDTYGVERWYKVSLAFKQCKTKRELLWYLSRLGFIYTDISLMKRNLIIVKFFEPTEEMMKRMSELLKKEGIQLPTIDSIPSSPKSIDGTKTFWEERGEFSQQQIDDKYKDLIQAWWDRLQALPEEEWGANLREDQKPAILRK